MSRFKHLRDEQKAPVRILFLDRLNIPEGCKLNYIPAIGYVDKCPDAKPRDVSKVKYIK